MRLRARLALTSLGVLVPLAVTLALLSDRDRQAGMDDTLRRVVDARLQDGADMCGDPLATRVPPPGPPVPGVPLPGGAVEFLGYREDFTPLQAGAPVLGDAQRQAIGAGRAWAGPFPTSLGRGMGLVFRAPAGARCAVVVARMRPRPGVRRDQAIALASSLVSVLAATWLAAGPVLARLRKLAGDVERSAAGHYAAPVRVPGPHDEVTELAQAFNDAGATVRTHLLQVEARGETLREFVANTTHDIAIPLSALQGHLSALESETALSADGRTQARHALQEAHYMGSLLRNLGTAARLDGARPLERHQVDLSALVERVVTRHRVLARARGVSLEYAVPEEAVLADTDLTLLEQAVGNLVDNALQYNDAGGHVAVVLDHTAPDRFVITVQDDGPGIPAQEREALLSARVRGTEARTRRPDGQGLGLAIVTEAARVLDLSLVFSHPATGGLRVEIAGASVRAAHPER